MANRSPEELAELVDVSTAQTPAAAVARWWAGLILNPTFTFVGESPGWQLIAPQAEALNRDIRQPAIDHLSDFIVALERLVAEGLRNEDLAAEYINCRYEPEPILLAALAEAGIDTALAATALFPFYSKTAVEHGIVLARSGGTDPLAQIWPPEVTSMQQE